MRTLNLSGKAALAVLALAAIAGPGSAQTEYPSQEITIVVPYPPGGTTDIYARIVSEGLEERLGQPVVVENRPGGATQIAASHVARSEPDGHTLMMSTITTMTMNPLMRENLTYDADDLVPVGLVARQSFALVVPPDFEVDTVEELVAHARDNPGVINFGTHGRGSSVHLVTELFSTAADIDIVPIHYGGSAPALTATMSGEVEMYFDGITTALPAIRDGRVKGIAMTGRQRAEVAPDLPTVAEEFPEVVAYTWYGLVAPAGTPQDVIELLNTEINEIVQADAVHERLLEDAVEPGDMTPEEFAAMIAEDDERWAKIVSDLGITLD